MKTETAPCNEAKMIKLQAPFDPDENKDYSIDWSAEMARTDDSLLTATFDVTVPASGLAVVSSNLDATNMFAVVWFACTDKPALTALAGTKVAIDHVVVTANGRTLNETVMLPIKIK